MEFKVMDNQLRLQLLDGVEDELAPLVKPPQTQTCPGCGKDMTPIKPEAWSGILPQMDYKCDCGVLQKASGVIVTGQHQT